jgi:hypothetical protein
MSAPRLKAAFVRVPYDVAKGPKADLVFKSTALERRARLDPLELHLNQPLPQAVLARHRRRPQTFDPLPERSRIADDKPG